MSEYKGNCLCGAVQVTAANMKKYLGACHCGMCRKWCGGPYFALDCGSAVTFTGEENITAYSSSEWAERGFCNKCGSNLFYKLKANNQFILSTGLFDNLEQKKHDEGNFRYSLGIGLH